MDSPQVPNRPLSDTELCEHLSSIPELIQPEFDESEELRLLIHTTPNLRTMDKYLLRGIDKLKQQMDFLIPAVVEHNKHVRKNDGQLKQIVIWHEDNNSKIEETIKKVKNHEELLNKRNTIKEFLKIVFGMFLGVLGALTAWFQIIEQIFGK